MIYRQANHEDLSYLVEMEKDLDSGKPDSGFWEPMSVLNHPMLPIDRMTVAEDGGRPVGMVGAIPVSADIWYLVNLYVLPEYRGKGVARSLVNTAACSQKTLGRTVANAIVATKVGDLYDKMGFVPVGRVMEWRHE